MNFDFWKIFGYSNELIPSFTSGLFVVFFSVLYLIWATFHHFLNARNTILLIFSLYFYYKLSNLYVFLLIAYSLIDFLIGLQLAKEKNETSRKLLFYTSLLTNLAILLYFKYLTFFLQVWKDLSGQEIWIPEILVPVGISFWIFRSISYIYDVYHELIDSETNYFHYLLYLSFFPSVLAGPIAKAGDFLSQLKVPLNFTNRDVGLAYWLLASGLVKKVVLSDPLGSNFVLRVFENPGFYTGLENFLAAFSYGFYLFYDFSGYTDIAIGISLLLGYRLPQNFLEPFKASNISDFWRRWHITLSKWFNDYVFFPLNMSMRTWGVSGLMIASFITFTLSGLWHGANWTYILWGSLHGVAIAWDVFSKNLRAKMMNFVPKLIYNSLSILLTYSYLVFTYFFFAAPSLDSSFQMFSKIANEFHPELFFQWIEKYQLVAIILSVGITIHFSPTSWKIAVQELFISSHWLVKIPILAILVILVYQIKSTGSVPFVYLQF